MTLDADKYRLNVDAIKSLTKDKDDAERIEFLGVLAIATGVPIIIVAVYLGELYGFSDALNATIGRLKAFYNIIDVLNVSQPSNP